LRKEDPLSKPHETSRRRVYGRRQHEILERTERPIGFLGVVGKAELPWPQDRWTASLVRPLDADWPNGRPAH
jgi:hypothetical protein